jgi:hypothetical protein
MLNVITACRNAGGLFLSNIPATSFSFFSEHQLWLQKWHPIIGHAARAVANAEKFTRRQLSKCFEVEQQRIKMAAISSRPFLLEF